MFRHLSRGACNRRGPRINLPAFAIRSALCFALHLSNRQLFRRERITLADAAVVDFGALAPFSTELEQLPLLPADLSGLDDAFAPLPPV